MSTTQRRGDALVDKVIAAHGGLDAWLRLHSLTVRFSARGLAFASRFQPRALIQAEATVHRGGQHIVVVGASPRAWSFVASTAEALRGAVEHLRSGRRRWMWLPEESGAFAAVAMWTYVQTPFCLAESGTRVREIAPSRAGYRRLEVRFPEAVATHSPRQILHVDDSGTIVRHDYTALAFGRWATAAQTLDGYRSFEGLRMPTVRRVTPRLPGGRRLPVPTLVDITIHDVSVA